MNKNIQYALNFHKRIISDDLSSLHICSPKCSRNQDLNILHPPNYMDWCAKTYDLYLYNLYTSVYIFTQNKTYWVEWGYSQVGVTGMHPLLTEMANQQENPC